jgi:hypothetical protein
VDQLFRLLLDRFDDFGWQWPVEQTATPALQSKNMLPSTSSTQTPLPRSATSLKEGAGRKGYKLCIRFDDLLALGRQRVLISGALRCEYAGRHFQLPCQKANRTAEP